MECGFRTFKPVFINNSFRVEAAAGSFKCKDEDRFTYVTWSENNDSDTEDKDESSGGEGKKDDSYYMKQAQSSLVRNDETEEDSLQCVAFAGIFDGHDGFAASSYCSQGLLKHVLIETQKTKNNRSKPRKSNAKAGNNKKFLFKNHHNDEDKKNKCLAKIQSRLEEIYISAYRNCEKRFVSFLEPPTFEDIGEGISTKKKNRFYRFFMRLLLPLKKRKGKVKRGGTTALSLGLYVAKQKENKTDDYIEKNNTASYAIVANTGDSRCITDDGSGTSFFRQITRDHRPTDFLEYRRIQTYISKGKASLDKRSGCLRVYPGGFAVSRCIGDAAFSKALDCTPDIFHVPLFSKSQLSRRQQQHHQQDTTPRNNEIPHRFIMASDGLWDILQNDRVGELAASHYSILSTDNCSSGSESAGGSKQNHSIEILTSDEIQHKVTPREAVQSLLTESLRSGGYTDDITVLVIDVYPHDSSVI